MNTAVGLAEQRTAIYDALVGCNIGNVDKYARKDPIPPGTMITDPRINFPDNSKVGVTEWSIWLLATRKAPSATGDELDANLTKVLAAFSKGCDIGLVLQRVENVVRTIEGYPLPGYTVVVSAVVPNC